MRILSYQFLLLFFLGMGSFNSFADNKPTRDNLSIVDKLNEVLSKQEMDEPGISVLLKKDDKIIFKQSAGLANKNENVVISASTGFRVGSISKPFTALAVMQLVESKVLSLDDEVTRYIPDLPANWQGITLRHLLTHRVSISDDFFSESNLQLANLSTNQDLIRFLSSKSIDVAARAFDAAVYCNSCFVLLAEVIANASGVSFASYLNQHIFGPANMANSYIVESGVVLKPTDALNYAKTPSFSGIKQYTTGAMAQVSSIEDLNNFMIALKSGKIISQKSLSMMTQVHSNAGDDGTFGLGWMIGWGEPPFFSHGGSQDGYQAELFFQPKHNLEIAILTNGGDKTYQLQAQLMRVIITHYD
ncbi:serine hydrolase domain-containing protein [Pseudoalteromonas sp. H105]|uniref:serine hydrolase domain-containing protein n=1 Tax=Pseudoalteromonas sp. H105 TaxID=1348393 RepID=UPI0007322698|nr:serine hydrolase domain-containing protein [Pseudoalteromonas sp. H105]KTF18489.1 hypothetical protein ATS75_03525 [Pseudoalteromonas sp. H105]